jgi:hypothetical protein
LGIKLDGEGDVVLDIDGGEHRGHAWGSSWRKGSPDCCDHGGNGILGVIVHGGVTKVEEGSGRGRNGFRLIPCENEIMEIVENLNSFHSSIQVFIGYT